VGVGEWEQAAVRLDAVAHRWVDPGAGGAHLRCRELDLARTALGITDRWMLTLSTLGGLLIDPIEGRARAAAPTTPRAPLSLVG